MKTKIDTNMKKTVIVDIDGTIATPGERLKYLKGKPDYEKFYASCFDDAPIEEIIDLVILLSKKYTIVYCTGRREQVRNLTADWLFKYDLPAGKLIMRPNGDKRHDTECKPEQLDKYGISLSEIAFILEDRNSMVKKWRELGVKCLHVADGNF
jgi:uncharacterized HAD superfamily protein